LCINNLKYSVMNTTNVPTLKFNEKKREYYFKSTNPGLKIQITEIEVHSLKSTSPDSWSGELQRLSPQLKLSFSSTKGGFNDVIDIQTLNTPLHRFPIFESDEVYPNPIGDLGLKINEYTHCKVELEYENIEGTKPDISVYYKTSPGVVLVEELVNR
jgi:hypothetical protein